MKPKYLNLVKHTNGVYYLQGKLLGKSIRESTRTRDYHEACLMAAVSYTHLRAHET